MSDDADLREAVRRLELEVDALHRRLDALEESTDSERTDPRPNLASGDEATTTSSVGSDPPAGTATPSSAGAH